MHTLTLKVQDSMYNHIIYLLKSMDKKEVEIIQDTHVTVSQSLNKQINDLLKEQKYQLFASIEDPMEWQRKLREEW